MSENHFPHWAHTIGVEVGLAVAEHGLHTASRVIASRGVASALGGAAKAIGTKAFGIPVIGPVIDILTPSHTIMSGSAERRLMRMERARAAGIHGPIVQQGVRYKSGATYFPQSRQLILPTVAIKASSHGAKHQSSHRIVPSSLPRFSAQIRPIQKMQLPRPSLTRHITHHRPTLGVPRLHLNRGLRPQQPSLAHRMASAGTMKLSRPQLRVAPPRHHFHAPVHFRR